LEKAFVYLCLILDLFSRKVIAWSVTKKIDTTLAITTIEKAIQVRKPMASILFHTDQGSRYTSLKFRKFFENYSKLTQLFTLCLNLLSLDTAATKAFFNYVKKEELNRRTFSSLQEVQLTYFEYIKRFYNPQRPHVTLDMLIPNEMEDKYFDSH